MSEPSHAVFLSYASRDAQAAQRICAALGAAGLDVFLDQRVDLKTDPLLDPLCQEPRFKAIERELKFPSQSAAGAELHKGLQRRNPFDECTFKTMNSSKALASIIASVALVFLPGGGSAAIAESTGSAAAHSCVVVGPGDTRPEFGCFRIGAVRNLRFNRSTLYWHLYAFPSRTTADAVRTSSDIIVEEDGRVWLSEFGPSNSHVRGGRSVAVIGPLRVLPGESYDAEIAYSVMRPSDHSRVHTHTGPEAWYVLTGVQCLETPQLTRSAGPGSTMTAAANVPMELRVTGTDVARSLTLVIHQSGQEFGTASDWQPAGNCR